MTTAQIDWIEQFPQVDPDALAALDHSLLRFRDRTSGRDGDIRLSMLKHRAALLGQTHAGAPIPPDTRFRDGLTICELLGTSGRYHAWAISDASMEMAGGYGDTPAKARAAAMVGLMLGLNEGRP